MSYDKYGSWGALKGHDARMQVVEDKRAVKRRERDTRHAEVERALAPYNISFERTRHHFRNYIQSGSGSLGDLVARAVEETREDQWVEANLNVHEAFVQLSQESGWAAYVSHEDSIARALRNWRGAHPGADLTLPPGVQARLLSLAD